MAAFGRDPERQTGKALRLLILVFSLMTTVEPWHRAIMQLSCVRANPLRKIA
jgi:hypothetical protein